MDIIGLYLKKMMRSGNAVLSHSSLIPSETVYEKRRGLAIYFCVAHDEKVTLQTLYSPFLLH